MRIFITAVLILTVCTTAMAFWSTGHMIISRIAYEDLKARNSTMLAIIEDEIKELKKFSNENKHNFVEAAIWADDNKEIEFNAFTPWHYTNTPYIMPDFTGTPEHEKMNVIWAIGEMMKTVSNKSKPKFNSRLALSFAWRYLIHLVGDLHQPLHASTMYSKQFFDGDQGGNLFLIDYPYDPEIKNLHALWDASVGQYGSIFAPLSDEEWDQIGLFASYITSNFTRADLAKRVAITDQNVWAEESFNIAKNVVYNLKQGETVSEEYLSVGRKVVNEQLAVGGYRLADMFENLFHKRFGTSVIANLLKE